MELIHKGCGGKLVLDLNSALAIRTRSMMLTEKGVFPGVMEITAREGGESLQLFCPKCSKTVSAKDSETISVKCPVCRKQKTINLVIITDIFPYICADCASMISGEKALTPEVTEIASFYNISMKLSGETILKILNKGISI